MEYKFNSPIRMRNQNGSGFAETTDCNLHFEKTFSGYRLNFDFKIQPYERDDEKPITLINWEVDIYYGSGSQEVLLGRMLNKILHENFPVTFGRRVFTVQKVFDISASDMVRLIELSHRGDMTFKFQAIPSFVEVKNTAKEEGYLTIPHSKWLEFINGLGLDRFELISIKVPVSSSHLHKPFSDALEKIREAERQYTKGDWNGAASSCRAAWRTILSATPDKTKAFEYLLSPVIGEPKRKKFAEAVIKAVHLVENEAVHLEGNQKTGTPPTTLNPEDALLCIHWYTSLVGYLSSL